MVGVFAGAIAAVGLAAFVSTSGRTVHTTPIVRRVAQSSTTSTVPTTTTTTRPAMNPLLPPVPAGTGVGRRIVYCNSCQRVWLVADHDYAETSYLVSGRRGTPSPGTYQVHRKLEVGRAKSNPSLRLPYFVGFAYGSTTDIGFHGIPLRSDGSPIESDAALGQPLSHGCVRENQAQAKLLYDWTPVGSTVVVTP